MSRTVVSAEDVRAAARRGDLRLAVPADAIVTPLARDEASRHGIELAVISPERRESSPPPAGRAATCDPDDVERIVDRVRARVPGAEPGQIRDIARRLLDRLGG